MSEPSAVAVQRRYKLSFLKTLRSERIKLFTLRSSWWLMVATIVANVGICAVLAFLLAFSESQMASGMIVVGPANGSMGLWSSIVPVGCGFVGQLIFIILSIVAITNEYSSGMIHSTMTVAPRRIRVLIAKMVVIAVTCVLVFAISVAASWALGYLILRQSVMVDLTLTSVVSLRILGGFVLEMLLVALLCFALGALIRSTAGAIGAAVGLILILPSIMQMWAFYLISGPKPTGWRKWLVDAQQFLPTTAGGQIVLPEVPSSALLGPWEGIGVLGGWTLLALVIAFVATARRDV